MGGASFASGTSVVSNSGSTADVDCGYCSLREHIADNAPWRTPTRALSLCYSELNTRSSIVSLNMSKSPLTAKIAPEQFYRFSMVVALISV